MSLSNFCRPEGWLGAQSRLVFRERVPSTHDVLRELAIAGATEGTVVLAEEQTAGRGRVGRRWWAPPGTSVLFSALFRPPEPFVYHAQRVMMACGLAVRAAVREVTGLVPDIKWPNDLIFEREGDWKKTAGILAETECDLEGAPYLMVGVGLNVNVPPEQLSLLSPVATSLQNELGQSVDRTAILLALLHTLEATYMRLLAGWDPLPEWRAALAWMGRPVQVLAPDGEAIGVAEAVSENGALVLRMENGARVFYSVGDVSLRSAAVRAT